MMETSMDIAYVFRHSEADDWELRYSLRSVATFLPWVRKVFVFGDRPEFLSGDARIIEHVPWEPVAWLGGFRSPVENWLLQRSRVGSRRPIRFAINNGRASIKELRPNTVRHDD